jgi:hypothetical protein
MALTLTAENLFGKMFRRHQIGMAKKPQLADTFPPATRNVGERLFSWAGTARRP